MLLVLLLWTGACFSGPEGVGVRLADVEVMTVYEAPGLAPAEARAKTATENLERALRNVGPIQLRVEYTESAPGVADRAKIYANDLLIVELSAVEAAHGGGADFRSYVGETASKIRETLSQERQRSHIAKQVLAVSTVVFLGLVALLLLRASRNWSRSARRYVKHHTDSIEPLRLATVELLPAGTLREATRAGLQIGSWVLQFVIIYAWGITSLSLFESTREIAERATGRLLAPALDLVERLAGRIPVVFALAFALLIVALVIRFISAYFSGVERGEVDTEWIRPAAARVTGHLLSVAVAISALLFVAPLLTGTEDGVFTRVGELGLGILALSTAPMLASCALGVRLVYTHLLSRGDLIRYGGRRGRIETIGLFDLVLITAKRSKVRVPHLFSLWHVTEIFPLDARADVKDGTDHALAESKETP